MAALRADSVKYPPAATTGLEAKAVLRARAVPRHGRDGAGRAAVGSRFPVAAGLVLAALALATNGAGAGAETRTGVCMAVRVAGGNPPAADPERRERWTRAPLVPAQAGSTSITTARPETNSHPAPAFRLTTVTKGQDTSGSGGRKGGDSTTRLGRT